MGTGSRISILGDYLHFWIKETIDTNVREQDHFILENKGTKQQFNSWEHVTPEKASVVYFLL